MQKYPLLLEVGRQVAEVAYASTHAVDAVNDDVVAWLKLFVECASGWAGEEVAAPS